MRRPSATARARGMTLVELMIAMALAAAISAGILWMMRTQLIAYQLNDQLTSAQQNARAGADFLEAMLRRSCAGLAYGQVGINVSNAPQQVTPCVQLWDGATTAAGTFTVGAGASAPDAIEIVYATGEGLSVATIAPAFATSAPSVTVNDVTPYVIGDLVLVTDWNRGGLFRVSGIQAAGGGTAGTLLLGGLTGLPVLPVGYVPAAGNTVCKAASVAIFLDQSNGLPGLLMLDPDGMAGANHLDAQPLVEAATDFQVAIGFDLDGNGQVVEVPGAPSPTPPDEWFGNAAGEVVPPPPWNRLGIGTDPQPRQLRATLVTQTTSTFAGAAQAPTQYEDRNTYTAPTFRTPRYRPIRIKVAPRVWNLGE